MTSIYRHLTRLTNLDKIMGPDCRRTAARMHQNCFEFQTEDKTCADAFSI
jgi:hypothetical protein